MEKIKFAVLILGLALSFPVWFYTEMRQADKTLKNNNQNQFDSTQVKKVMAITEAAETAGSGITIMPFSKHMEVSN